MKVLLKIIFIVLITTSSYGQKVKFGVKGGMNISNAKFVVTVNENESDRDFGNRISYYLGTDAEFNLNSSNNKSPSIIVELIYSKQGYDFGGIYTVKVDQINIPILYKQPIIDNFSLSGGGYLGYVINYQEENNSAKYNQYKNFDIGLLIGIRYQFSFNLYLESRYLYGLADISDVEFPSSMIEWDHKNRVLQLGIGYNF